MPAALSVDDTACSRRLYFSTAPGQEDLPALSADSAEQANAKTAGNHVGQDAVTGYLDTRSHACPSGLGSSSSSPASARGLAKF